MRRSSRRTVTAPSTHCTPPLPPESSDCLLPLRVFSWSTPVPLRFTTPAPQLFWHNPLIHCKTLGHHSSFCAELLSAGRLGNLSWLRTNLRSPCTRRPDQSTGIQPCLTPVPSES